MSEPTTYRVEPIPSRSPVRLGPWDEPWCKVHRLTRPMFVTLYDAATRRDRPGRVRSVYPGGQWRLIRNGLYGRWLIDERQELTASGLVLATWAECAMRRAYPARPGEVATR